MTFLFQTHVGLMVLSLSVIVAAAIVARFMKKKPWWFKSHRSAAITGAVLFLIAFSAIILHVTFNEEPHFRIVHSWVGLIAFVFVVLTPTLGMLQFTLKNKAAKLRSFHRWSGRITICLMIVNVVLGLLLIGVL